LELQHEGLSKIKSYRASPVYPKCALALKREEGRGKREEGREKGDE